MNIGEKAFTLIETMIAVAIIGVIVIPLMGLFSQSTTSNIKSQEISLAVALAQEKIEEIKACPFTELQSLSGMLTHEDIEVDRMLYKRRTQIRPEAHNLLMISVEVLIKSEGVKLVTYRTDF